MGRESKWAAGGVETIFFCFPTALLAKFDAEIEATRPRTNRQALFVHIFEQWLDADDQGTQAPLPAPDKRLNRIADSGRWTLHLPKDLLARIDAKAWKRRPVYDKDGNPLPNKYARRHFVCEVLEQRYGAEIVRAATA